MLGGVVYDELFNPPSENPPATAAPVDHPSRRQPRLADLSGQLDDASTDRRVGHRMFLSNAAPRANQARANHLPARKRKRYEALFPELLALLLYVTAIRRRSQVRGSYSRTRLDRRVSKYHIRVLGWQGSRLLVDSGKRPADFGAGLRPNESDSRESLYGSLVELAESSVMA